MYKYAVISEKHQIKLSRSESECKMELKERKHAQNSNSAQWYSPWKGGKKSRAPPPPLPLRYPKPNLMTSPGILCNFGSEA